MHTYASSIDSLKGKKIFIADRVPGASLAQYMLRRTVLLCLALCLAASALSANALSLTGVQSRKIHQLGTGTFDLPVDTTQSMSGMITVESRAIGAGHTIVFQFDGPIASTGTLTVIDNTIAPVAGVTAARSGNDVVVTLSTLADNKRVTISLDNINGIGLNVAASLGFRLGDTNNSGTVSPSDVSSVKARSGQLATNANFRFDLDASGVVTAAEISAVKARSGTLTLPSVTHFVLVPNAFPDMTPIHASLNNAEIWAAGIGDFNGDGKSDLAFLYQGDSAIGAIVTTPCANRLVIMTYQANGTFKDETAALVTGNPDLGGCPTKMKVLDLNGDGRPDIVVAINQEDSRSSAPPSLTTAQLAALISTADGHYVVRKFGSPNWYNSVGVGYDAAGMPFVTGMGYYGGATESFRVIGTDVVQVPNMLPVVSSNTFEFYTDSSTNQTSRFLLQDGTFPNLLGVEGYVLADDGTWTKATTLDSPFPVVGSIDLVTWSSDIARNIPVLKVDEYYVLGGGGFAIPTSALGRLSPGASPLAVMRLELPRIPNYTPGALIQQSDLTTNSKLVATTIANGQVAAVPLVLDTTELLDIAYYYFFEFKDVNGDGYEDLLAYRFRSYQLPDADYAKPLVYLNRRNGSFRLVDLAQFPTPILQAGDETQSILHDFDGDGIPDLVYYPRGAGLGNGPSYLFYKGVRLLD